MLSLAGAPLWGQQPAPAQRPPLRRSPYKRLAGHVMKTVDPDLKQVQSFSRHDTVELLSFDPNFDWAKDITYRHEVWALEFKFKPLRMIWVDIPQPSGRMRPKQIWYMVYSVTNPGKVMVPVDDLLLPYDDALHDKKRVYEVKRVDKPVRFVPEFLLEGHNSLGEGEGFSKVYQDRVIPVAVGPIRLREDPHRRFYTTVDICREIAVGETFWGIAMWEAAGPELDPRGLDPEIDRFSIYIKGLTNAYRWRDEPGELKKGDRLGKGRQLFQKTLKINFWRPGDKYDEHEGEIRYGLPGGVDYEWVYR